MRKRPCAAPSAKRLAPRINGGASDLLQRTAAHAARYLAEIGERHAGAPTGGAELRRMLGQALPETGDDPEVVIDELARAGWEGTTASQGPRYFGFVTGGAYQRRRLQIG